MTDEMVPDLDLGEDHFLVFTRWAPDDLPANRVWLNLGPLDPMPVVERFGAIVRHYKPNGELCEGAITFAGEWQRRSHQSSCALAREEGRPEPREHVWAVECWEPLTVSPSLLCACGDHGFIRNGRWVRA